MCGGFSQIEHAEVAANKQPTPETKTEWTQSADVSDDGQYLHDFTLEN